MENKKIKTIIAISTLLFGIALADDIAIGTYSATVPDVKKVWMSADSEATAEDANSILSSPLVLEFTVETNLEKWDLELETANGGRLLKDDEEGTPLKTDLSPDGSLGLGDEKGTLHVQLKEYEEGKIKNVIEGNGGDVFVNKEGSVKIAKEAFKEEEFENEDGFLVRAVFEVKASLAGSIILAPPGTYTETVTITLISNDQ